MLSYYCFHVFGALSRWCRDGLDVYVEASLLTKVPSQGFSSIYYIERHVLPMTLGFYNTVYIEDILKKFYLNKTLDSNLNKSLLKSKTYCFENPKL